MTSANLTNEVLKQDRRGRVLVPQERREALLAEFARSGVSGAQFARMAGVKYATFANWRQQERRRAIACEAAENSVIIGGEGQCSRGQRGLRLLEAVVEDGGRQRPEAASAARLLIELPGGSRLTVVSPVQLPMAVELLALLAQRS